VAGSAKITVAITGTTLKGEVNISRSMTFSLGNYFEQSIRSFTGTPAATSDFMPRFLLFKNLGTQNARIATRSNADAISVVEAGDVAVLFGVHSDVNCSGNGLVEAISMAELDVMITGEGGEGVLGEGGEIILPES
jgi:uncharacterized protein with GYD domain